MARRHVSAIASLYSVVLIGGVPAQTSPMATVSGHVFDIRNQPVAGATVLLMDTRTGTLTNRGGEYTLISTPGTISLLVTARGLKPYQLTGLRLIANTTVTQDFKLEDSVRRILPYPGFGKNPGYTVDQVDDPVQFIGGPLPKYPDSLKAAKVEGRVTLRFIVGTDGKVEASSLQVISSTNREFETPALDAISKSTFRPARLKGQAVRQMVEQVVRFTLK